MQIKVTVRPEASRETVNQIKDSGGLIVTVKEPPKNGRANRAVIRALAAHFNIKENRVKMIRGKKSPKKIIEIS